jgi:hypothetical protein
MVRGLSRLSNNTHDGRHYSFILRTTTRLPRISFSVAIIRFFAQRASEIPAVFGSAGKQERLPQAIGANCGDAASGKNERVFPILQKAG